MPQRSEFEELAAALPELQFLQPRGILRCVVQSGAAYLKEGFGRQLAAAIGTAARKDGDLDGAFEKIRRYLALPVPLYFEDDAAGVGACAVCGKRGVLGRCDTCGLLLHLTCASPRLPGRVLECPRCAPLGGEVQDPARIAQPWALGIKRANFCRNEPLVAAAAGLEKGLDSRIPCPLDIRPTDEAAQQHGFLDAADWYAFSAGGGVADPSVARRNFETMPEHDEDDEVEPPSGLAQT